MPSMCDFIEKELQALEDQATASLVREIEGIGQYYSNPKAKKMIYLDDILAILKKGEK